MRIKKNQIEFLKEMICSFLPDASVFLFGSRVFDDMKGGDIDLLVLGNRHVTLKMLPVDTHEKYPLKHSAYLSPIILCPA